MVVVLFEISYIIYIYSSLLESLNLNDHITVTTLKPEKDVVKLYNLRYELLSTSTVISRFDVQRLFSVFEEISIVTANETTIIPKELKDWNSAY